jgi:hypothetical protein
VIHGPTSAVLGSGRRRPPPATTSTRRAAAGRVFPSTGEVRGDLAATGDRIGITERPTMRRGWGEPRFFASKVGKPPF